MVSKFRGILEGQRFYGSFGKKTDRYLFVDIDTNLVSITSPIPDPFGKEWNWIVSQSFNKSDESKYPARVEFKLFEPTVELSRCIVTRDLYKGKFIDSQYLCLRHLGFPSKTDSMYWVSYMIIQA